MECDDAATLRLWINWRSLVGDGRISRAGFVQECKLYVCSSEAGGGNAEVLWFPGGIGNPFASERQRGHYGRGLIEQKLVRIRFF